MKCPKCGETLKMVIDEADHVESFEVRAECKCGYWSYTFVHENNFVEGD